MTADQATQMLIALAPCGGIRREVSGRAEMVKALHAHITKADGYLPGWLKTEATGKATGTGRRTRRR